MRTNENDSFALFQKQKVNDKGVSRALLLEVAVFSLYNALVSLEKKEIDSALTLGKLALESISCSAAPKSV
jgi:hypothetical protein